MKRRRSFFTVTDQFCGCGGSTEGAEDAGATVTQAQNHWQLACDTYAANHRITPDCADVSNTNPRRYASTDMLITSPECTNHSVAKGKKRVYYTEDLFGQQLIDPSEERSRATMWDVVRFADYHEYEMIITENVVDVANWRLFDSWLTTMHNLGYEHKAVYFNSMFAHPVPQSRDRIYIVFWKKGNKAPDLEIRPKAYCLHCGRNVEAIQTWKKRREWGKYGKQYFYRCSGCNREVVPYYYAGFNAIDWTIPTVRIGDRESLGKKPLAESTLKRLQYGLDLWGQQMMIISPRYKSGLKSRIHLAHEEPFPTVVGDNSHAVVMPWIIDVSHTKSNGNLVYHSSSPLPTQTTTHSLGIASLGFMSKTYGTDDFNKGHVAMLTEPMGTMVGSGSHHALVQTDAFLSYYYGTHQASNLAEPIRTIRSKDNVALVQNTKAPTLEDLYYRMMVIPEIAKTMGFPLDYKVLGDSKSQVKQYGNAVTPPVMKLLMKRCMATFQ